ncbi:MAG TPA: hypothetical protein VJ696_10560 [Rhodanobacteraceae bacterium]|nr:hypothetical protein [Rhodanobacteraceae bacterium]
MKVLIIPEDQTLDGFIAKPVVAAIFADLGIRARVDVLPEPRLRGASHALDQAMVASIVRENPMTDIFILIVDRDCDRDGHVRKAAARMDEHADRLVACLATEELEVWMLALHRNAIDTPWREIRGHCDPKERWATPLLLALGTGGPGGGRKNAMSALGGQLRTLLALCDELQELRNRLAGMLAGMRRRI